MSDDMAAKLSLRQWLIDNGHPEIPAEYGRYAAGTERPLSLESYVFTWHMNIYRVWSARKIKIMRAANGDA